MGKLHTWQRGAADLVSVVMGMTILAIAFAGTSAAMTYGRATLIKSERYKIAAYHLRSAMEQTQAYLQTGDYNSVLHPRTLSAQVFRASRNSPFMLENSRERNNGGQDLSLTITQDPIGVARIIDPEGVDYFRLTMRASWLEPDPVGADQLREIVYSTSVYKRN